MDSHKQAVRKSLSIHLSQVAHALQCYTDMPSAVDMQLGTLHHMRRAKQPKQGCVSALRYIAHKNSTAAVHHMPAEYTYEALACCKQEHRHRCLKEHSHSCIQEHSIFHTSCYVCSWRHATSAYAVLRVIRRARTPEL